MIKVFITTMLNKILILIWKDLLMRKNHYIATAMEVIIPVGIIMMGNLFLPNFVEKIDNDPILLESLKVNECTSSHFGISTVLYEPSTKFTDKLMSQAACHPSIFEIVVKPGNLTKNSSIFDLGITFDLDKYSSEIPDTLNYTLYSTYESLINLQTLWASDFTVPKYSRSVMLRILKLQRAVDASFLRMKNISAPKLDLMNTKLYPSSPNVFSIVVYFSLFLAFSLMAPPIIGRVVEEKCTGSKELMLMMGVKKCQLWISKFLESFLFLMITVSGMVIFLFVPLKEDANVLTIPPMILWAVIVYGLIGVTIFLFFLSCFFEKANVAIYVAEIIWSFSFVFNNLISKIIVLPIISKYFISFIPCITLMNGISVLLDFNFYGKQVKLTERLSRKDDYLTLSQILIIMTFNIILFSILTWYFEQVKPGKYGVPKSYGFPFKKSYWVPNKKIDSRSDLCLNNLASDEFECVPPNLKTGIAIQNLFKVYKSTDKGSVTAVDNVSINFYHGEISALLGHNGAGKTTIFSIITGLSCPTSGTVIMNGFNVATDISEVRKSLGLCPQQDMLFNDLTALQILKFYGVVKGLSFEEATREGKKLMQKLKLSNVENTESCKLSGGQKRKVSLAIALIGGSEIIILDEPTSGMDPEIRREIWEILLSLRGLKTILLTTHFMEEADALCDRIAIMHSGKIKCYGSSMFLKSKYGKGYVLSIVLKDVEQAPEITSYLKNFIPQIQFRSQNIKTVSYELNESEVENFPDLLCGLDEKQTKNEITSYSISLSTLEDVFLKTSNTQIENSEFVDSPYRRINCNEDFMIPKVTGTFLWFYQFWVLFLKKCTLFKGSYKTFLLYCIFPISLIGIIAISSLNKRRTNKIFFRGSDEPLQFSADLYSPFLVYFSDFVRSNVSSIFSEFIRSLNCDPEEVPDINEAIYKVFSTDFHQYARNVNLAVSFSPNNITIAHNEEAVHMVPVSVNIIHNFLLKLYNSSGTIVTSISPKFSQKSFVPAIIPQCNLEDIPDFSGIQTLFFFLMPLKEQLSGAKQLQLMITPAPIYWLSHLLFDILLFSAYMVVVGVVLGVSPGNDLMIQYKDEVALSLLFWGVGMILLSYVLSMIFNQEAKAFSAAIMIYIIFLVINDAVRLFDLPSFILYLHPSSILKLGYSYVCSGKSSLYILALFLYDLFLFGFLVLKDSKILDQAFHSTINSFVKVNYDLEDEKDELVIKEEKAVRKLIASNMKKSNAILVVSELKKWYFKSFKPSPAVRGISFKVNEGECFGLLGVNGAGKTSTFRMLTGDIPPSSGNAYVSFQKLNPFSRQKYLHHIGYCPQSGGLIPSFKGEDLLKFFGQLRGIRRSQIGVEVQKWLGKLGLLELANKKCGTYSGGNQRKLSTAISLIGDCNLIFLDEPTSGVDPVSRRTMWNVIDGVRKNGQSVVLTSHSMDECEALCSRLAIMVNSRFRCIGEITTLKEKFGQGYCIQLKVSCGASEENIESLKNAVDKSFNPGCNIVDQHLTVLQYFVMNKCITWADLFSKLKALKNDYEVLESYNASATTLEQIFIYLARNQ